MDWTILATTFAGLFGGLNIVQFYAFRTSINKLKAEVEVTKNEAVKIKQDASLQEASANELMAKNYKVFIEDSMKEYNELKEKVITKEKEFEVNFLEQKKIIESQKAQISKLEKVIKVYEKNCKNGCQFKTKNDEKES